METNYIVGRLTFDMNKFYSFEINHMCFIFLNHLGLGIIGILIFD